MTVQEWYNIYQTLCLRLQESFYIIKSRFILFVIFKLYIPRKNHTSSIKMPLTVTWNGNIMIDHLRAIGTSEHHMSTDVVRTSKNIATNNQCYLDVIFITSDRRVLTDVVRTLVSGRRRRDLHTTNTRRRETSGAYWVRTKSLINISHSTIPHCVPFPKWCKNVVCLRKTNANSFIFQTGACKLKFDKTFGIVTVYWLK